MRSLAEHHSLGCCGQQWCRKQWRRHHAAQAFGGNQWWGVAGWEGKFWKIWLSKVCKSVETFDILFGMGFIQIIDAKRKWWGCNFYHLQMRLQDSHPQLPFVNSAAQGDGQPAQGAEASGGWDDLSCGASAFMKGFFWSAQKQGWAKEATTKATNLNFGSLLVQWYIQYLFKLKDNSWTIDAPNSPKCCPPKKKLPSRMGTSTSTPFFSRMRSEGFPFIVGVWGWTCVRFVFLVSSSPRRRVVVASWSPTRRQLVNFSPLGRYIRTATHILLSKYEKWRKSRTKCSFWRCQVTKWEVVFVFCVTGAILWQCVNASALFFRGRRSTLWCGFLRCRGRRSILWRGEGAISTNRTGSDVQTWH